MDDLLSQLERYKSQDNFPVEDWEERGLNPSDEATRRGMNLAVAEFADLLIAQISTGETAPEVMHEKIQAYFDGQDNEDFDTEEREYIGDVQCELARLVGVDCGDLFI